jgi:hypothetical protein
VDEDVSFRPKSKFNELVAVREKRRNIEGHVVNHSQLLINELLYEVQRQFLSSDQDVSDLVVFESRKRTCGKCVADE